MQTTGIGREKLIYPKVFGACGLVNSILFVRIKVSIMLLFSRIFRVDRALRMFIYGGMIFHILFYGSIIGYTLGVIVFCTDTVRQFSNQYCVDYAQPISLLTAVVNVVTDFYVLILPIPSILKLQLDTKRKLGLMMVFAAGGIHCMIFPVLSQCAKIVPAPQA